MVALVAWAASGCVANTSAFDAGQPDSRASYSGTRAADGELLQRHLEAGVGYLRNRDYARARDKLNRALEIDPESVPVHTAVGLLFQLEGEAALAERHFNTAIRHGEAGGKRHDEALTQAHNNYGAFLFSLHRYDEAVAQLTIAAGNQFYMNRASVFENLGVAHARAGEPEGAVAALTRAIRLNPEQPRALLELAEIRFDEQDYAEAGELYHRHTQVTAHSPASLWLCIRVSAALGHLDEAASCELALKNLYPASEEFNLYREADL